MTVNMQSKTAKKSLLAFALAMSVLFPAVLSSNSYAATITKNITAIDGATKIQFKQDSNDTTHLIVEIGEDRKDFSFTDQELEDLASLKNKLSALPDDVQNRVIELVQSMTGEHALMITRNGNLDEATKLRLEKLHRELANKEAEIEKSVHAFEIHIKDTDFNTVEMDAKRQEIDKLVQEFASRLEGSEQEFTIEIQQLTDGVDKLVTEIIELEGLDMSHDANKVIVIKQNDDDVVAHIKTLIEQDQLSEADKQALIEALK